MTILVPAGFRSQVLAAFPITIRKRCRADIGVLILFIGRVNAGFVRPPVASMPVVDGAVAGSPTPPVALGQRSGIPVLPAGVGLAVAALLTARRVRGALRIAILAPTSLAFFTHFLTGPGVSKALGLQSGVPPVIPDAIVRHRWRGHHRHDLNFADFTEHFSARLAITVMPLTESLIEAITNGVRAAVAADAVVTLVAGRARGVHWLMWVVAGAFVLDFALLSVSGWDGAAAKSLVGRASCCVPFGGLLGHWRLRAPPSATHCGLALAPFPSRRGLSADAAPLWRRHLDAHDLSRRRRH